MGLIRVPVTLKGRKRTVRVTALVDTGASLTVIPRSIAARLELPALRTMTVHLADGRRQRMPVSAAIVRLDGREVPSTVFVAPGGEVLLGAETLELLDVSVDPKRRRLKFGKFFGLKIARWQTVLPALSPPFRTHGRRSSRQCRNRASSD